MNNRRLFVSVSANTGRAKHVQTFFARSGTSYADGGFSIITIPVYMINGDRIQAAPIRTLHELATKGMSVEKYPLLDGEMIDRKLTLAAN